MNEKTALTMAVWLCAHAKPAAFMIRGRTDTCKGFQ